MRQVVLYGKEDCHLCHHAESILQTLQAEYGFHLQKVDVSTDQELYARYKDVVPVVVVNGGEPLIAAFTERRLRQALEAERMAAPTAVAGPLRHVVLFLDRLILALARHWLFTVNLVTGIFAGLPLLAPFLMAMGYSGPAGLIYVTYRLTCHQLSYRSFFLFGPRATYSLTELTNILGATYRFDPVFSAFVGNPALGYKMAWCERNAAIYTTIFLVGLAFALVRHRLKPLSWQAFLLLIAPMAIDGSVQLVGWHESNWQLRLITGALFGLACVWLVYPYVQLGMEEISDQAIRKSGNQGKER